MSLRLVRARKQIGMSSRQAHIHNRYTLAIFSGCIVVLRLALSAPHHAVSADRYVFLSMLHLGGNVLLPPSQMRCPLSNLHVVSSHAKLFYQRLCRRRAQLAFAYPLLLAKSSLRSFKLNKMSPEKWPFLGSIRTFSACPPTFAVYRKSPLSIRLSMDQQK